MNYICIIVKEFSLPYTWQLVADHLKGNNCIYIVLFSGEEIQFQPALVSLFCRRGSDELTAKETVKEHLWDVYFSEYGRYS